MNKLNDIECFLLDMDGTFYLGNELIEGSLDFINTLTSRQKQYVFLTNNSSRSSEDYQKKLKGMGLDVSLGNIVNSGEVTANYVKDKKREAGIYVVGTPALKSEFLKMGLNVTDKTDDNIDFLVLGFDTTLTYEKLWAAHDLILADIPYVATNPDYVCPLEEGKTMPDCGAMISLLKASTGKEPLVIGKPNTLMIDYISRKMNIPKEKIAMVGDRLYTDIQAAINADITSILVLSGETDIEMLADAPQEPDYVFESLKEIKEKIS